MSDTMESEEKARFLLDILEDRKAVEPVLLDVRGKTVIADFFLICSGTSNIHIRAIADRVLEGSGEAGIKKPRIEGWANAEWILLDFGDVILHVMAEEPRARYRLEEFWTKPHGASEAPPTPSTAGNGHGALSDADLDAVDDEDDEETEFFNEADREVEPVDEDDLDEYDDEDLEDLDEEEADEDFDPGDDKDEGEEEDDDDPDGLHRRIQ